MNSGKKANKKEKRDDFNVYFAELLDNLGYGIGYHRIAKNVKELNVSIYDRWDEFGRDSRFFQVLNKLIVDPESPTPEIRRCHRKYLQSIFEKGENAVRRASRFSKETLKSRLEPFQVLGNRRYCDTPRYFSRADAPAHVAY